MIGAVKENNIDNTETFLGRLLLIIDHLTFLPRRHKWATYIRSKKMYAGVLFLTFILTLAQTIQSLEEDTAPLDIKIHKVRRIEGLKISTIRRKN